MSHNPFSLKSYNTFGLNVSCKAFIDVTSITELIQCCQLLQQQGKPFLILGGGSNVLLLEDYLGTVIHIAIKGIDVTEDTAYYYLSVAAGESWHGLVQFCLSQGIAGLENMALIPGTVGAAPIQNVGAYGLEFAAACDWVEYLELPECRITRLRADACEFGYRESIFKQQLRNTAIITRVGIKLPKAWKPILNYGPLKHLPVDSVTPQQIYDIVCQVRQQKLPDPAVLGNVGSCFKNPVIDTDTYQHLAARYPDIVAYELPDGKLKIAAAWLIDRADLKGQTFGEVMVHEGQPLVLVNLGRAKGADVVQALKAVRAKVHQVFGIVMEPEPRTYGAYGERGI
jgi:UDP-N-acetylmuramate dehydrogenase